LTARSKKEYRCTNCNAVFIKWQGICPNCKLAGVIEEFILIPAKVTPTTSQRSLQRRSKRSERSIARRMQDVDGEAPEFARIASSTGRVGHITNLRIDAVSKNYVTENKNRVLPTWLIKAWILINQRSIDFNKHALLHIDPPNMPKTIPLNGKHEKLDTIALLGQTWHEELLIRDQKLRKIETILFGDPEIPSDKIIEELLLVFKE
jgi:hypothetical protein